MIDEIKFKKYLIDKNNLSMIKGIMQGTKTKEDALVIIDRHNTEFIKRYNSLKEGGLDDESIKKIFDDELLNVSKPFIDISDKKNYEIIKKFCQTFDFYKNNYLIINPEKNIYSGLVAKNEAMISNDIYKNLVEPEIKEIENEIIVKKSKLKYKISRKALSIMKKIFPKYPKLQETVISGILWNDNYNHYRFYKDKIYYLDFRSNTHQLFYNEYDIDFFCKGVDEFTKETSLLLTNYRKKQKIQKILLTLATVAILILLTILVSK